MQRTFNPQNRARYPGGLPKENLMRKVYVELKVRVILRADEDCNIPELLDNLALPCPVIHNDKANVEDWEVLESKVTDSK
jgi:hypothetical protein